MKGRCYLAHPITDYGGPRQREAIASLVEDGWEVESPDTEYHCEAYKWLGMQHFIEVVQECDALTFMRFPNGAVGAGVASEIKAALACRMPVFELDGTQITEPPEPILTVEETREMIKKLRTTLHVVALSGGKDSTALALRLAELHPDWHFNFVCTPTGDEPPDMIDHWVKLGRLLGSPVIPVTRGIGLDGLIRKQNALPNWRHRWCTRMLKIEPYAAWLEIQAKVYGKVVSHVGLRADEEEREGGDYSHVPGVEMVFDLREWGWMLDSVLGYLKFRDIAIPKRTDCLKCFYQRLIEWYEFWRDNLASWMEGEVLEELTGHTFRSPGRDTWPASMKGLRARFEAGDIPKDTRRDPLKEMQCRVCRL